MNPLQVLQQGPYRDSCPLVRRFYISLIFLTKVPLNKEIYLFSQKALERRGPYGNRRPFPEP